MEKNHIWYGSSIINPSLNLYKEDNEYVLYTGPFRVSCGGPMYTMFLPIIQEFCKNNQDILVLGWGGGTIDKILYDQNIIPNSITGIELDELMLKIYSRWFKFNNMVNTINADAYDWIKNTNITYDIIIIDIFSKNEVPEKFLTLTFFEMLKKCINNHGVILWNIIQSYEKIKNIFSNQSIFQFEIKKIDFNYFVILHKK